MSWRPRGAVGPQQSPCPEAGFSGTPSVFPLLQVGSRELGQLQFFSPWGKPPAAPSTAASAPRDTPAPGSHQPQHSAIPRLSYLHRPASPAPSNRIPCGDLAWEPPMSPPDPVQVLLPAAPPCKALHRPHGGSGSHSGDSHCAGGSHSICGNGGNGGSCIGSDIAPVMIYQVEGREQQCRAGGPGPSHPTLAPPPHPTLG